MSSCRALRQEGPPSTRPMRVDLYTLDASGSGCDEVGLGVGVCESDGVGVDVLDTGVRRTCTTSACANPVGSTKRPSFPVGFRSPPFLFRRVRFRIGGNDPEERSQARL